MELAIILASGVMYYALSMLALHRAYGRYKKDGKFYSSEPTAGTAIAFLFVPHLIPVFFTIAATVMGIVWLIIKISDTLHYYGNGSHS